jgi:hypothetical protein
MLCVCPVKKIGMTPNGASSGMASRELGKVKHDEEQESHI